MVKGKIENLVFGDDLVSLYRVPLVWKGEDLDEESGEVDNPEAAHNLALSIGDPLLPILVSGLPKESDLYKKQRWLILCWLIEQQQTVYLLKEKRLNNRLSSVEEKPRNVTEEIPLSRRQKSIRRKREREITNWIKKRYPRYVNS